MPTHPITDSDARIGSWTALLAHWTQAAKIAAVLPTRMQGDQWRASLAPALSLHATAMALAELGLLPADQRPLALDLAQRSITAAISEIRRAWLGQDLPLSLEQLMSDARQALQHAGAALPPDALTHTPAPPAAAHPDQSDARSRATP